jgi:hypothetical protein
MTCTHSVITRSLHYYRNLSPTLSLTYFVELLFTIEDLKWKQIQAYNIIICFTQPYSSNHIITLLVADKLA